MLNTTTPTKSVLNPLSSTGSLNAWIESKRDANELVLEGLKLTSAHLIGNHPIVALVDDEPVVAITLAEILSKHGITAVWFTNTNDALRFLQSTKIDLLLSDYNMPELDGLSLIEQVHSLQPTCLFFLFSGIASETHLCERVEQTGLPIYLAAKPLCPRRLVDTIHLMIGKAKREPERHMDHHMSAN